MDCSDSVHLWCYAPDQKWYKHKSVHGPLALDGVKNLLAVDSLREEDDEAQRYKFEVVKYNGSQFVGKFKFNDELDGHLYWIVLAHIAQDSKGNLWFSYYDDRHGETFGVVCNNTLYNTLDGLGDDNVRSITPEGTGTVWCATDGGISKFTGTSWVNYDTTDGVASNLVYRILIGSNNKLYAATSKGISILESNRFKTLKTTNEPLHNDYTDMVIDKRGTVILAGGDHIAMYRESQWKMNYFQNIHIKEPYYLREQHETYNNRKSFFTSKDGTLYAIGNEIMGKGSVKGHILKQVTDGSRFLELYSHTLEEKYDRFLSPVVIGSGNNSNIWLTTRSNRLIYFNNQTADILDYSGFGGIRSMLLDHDERSIWVGWGSSGVVHFDGDTIKKRITQLDGLASGYVNSISRDSSGNLWFATGKAADFLHITTISGISLPHVMVSLIITFDAYHLTVEIISGFLPIKELLCENPVEWCITGLHLIWSILEEISR
ncbi:MAG: two-component regulator propeller domain-containing protein [Chitinispirillia bacterium]|jgi:ligand-binding sensor domain-containing protein